MGGFRGRSLRLKGESSDSCTDTQSEKQKQRVHFYAVVIILAREEFQQRPEVAEEEEKEMEGSELKGLRRDVRHAGGEVLEPLKASGVYVCWSEAAEKGERGNTGMKEREKDTPEMRKVQLRLRQNKKVKK